MKRALMHLTPVALFAMWVWVVISGIDPMVTQENNNHAIARLLGCEYIGRLKEVSGIILHKCDGKIELVEELKW
jgi:hypothetical protein